MKTTKRNKVVLVTGASGQLGQTIKDFKASFEDMVFEFKDRNELDITDYGRVRAYFKSKPIDFVINCAAYTNVERAESEPDKAFEVNTEAVKHLAKTCAEHQITLIHISTDYVFDGEKHIPYSEDDKPNPINNYGKSKLQGEMAIQHQLKNYYIIRTSWLYSAYGNNFVNTMLRLSKNNEKVDVVSDQVGSPTAAIDLAQLIIKIIAQPELAYGTYHFSNEGQASWYDFANEIFAQKGIKTKAQKVSSKELETQAKRPAFSVLDTTKLAQELNINIQHWKISLNSSLFKNKSSL